MALSRSKLSWFLCDGRGRALGQLTNRLDQPSVQVALNGQRTAKVSISTEDPLAGAVYPLVSRIKCFLGGTIIFNGVVMTPRMAAERPTLGGIEINAVDSSAQLMASYWGRWANPLPAGEKWASRQYTDWKQEDIMWDLVVEADRWASDTRGSTPHAARYPNDPNNVIPGIGIIRGNHTGGTVKRDRNYAEGKQIWEAMVQLASVRDGCDIELAPLDRDDGVFCQLNTYYPSMGRNNTDNVILEYGFGRNTASDFSWEPDGTQVVNRYYLVGQAGQGKSSPAYVAESRESQQLFGIWQLAEGAGDVKSMSHLQQKAEALVAARAFPIDFFDVTPVTEIGGQAIGWRRNVLGTLEPLDTEGGGYSVPPYFAPDAEGGDYWVGDTITCWVKIGPPGEKPVVEVRLPGVITDATLTEIDDDGNLVADLTCAPIIDKGGVSGYDSSATVRDAL